MKCLLASILEGFCSVLGTKLGGKTGPKGGPKIDPKRHRKNDAKQEPFRTRLGAVLGRFWLPKRPQNNSAGALRTVVFRFIFALKLSFVFDIVFSRFGSDFGGSWASKSAALLAAPGVLEPTAFYACINILHVLTRGRPGDSKI